MTVPQPNFYLKIQTFHLYECLKPNNNNNIANIAKHIQGD